MAGYTRKATGGISGIDRQEARRALALFVEDWSDSEGLEVFSLPSSRSRVLPAADLDGLVGAVEELSDGKGVYWRICPVSASMGDRAARVGDAVRRSWLLIDLDPIKPEENKDDSATPDEHLAVMDLARTVKDWLAEVHGWPSPLLVDSGNGAQLLYRVNLPANDEARDLLKGVIYALHARFDGRGGKVDRSVHKANQLAKVPGTWARKGIATADRPHRMTKLLEAPSLLLAVSREQIESVTSITPDARANGQTSGNGFTRRATTGRRPSIPERAAAYLDRCPAAISGQGGHNATLNAARGVVWGFDLGAAAGFDLLWSRYNPRCQPPWSERELRHKCEEADTVEFGKPRGWLLQEEHDQPSSGPSGGGASAAPQPEDSWEPPIPLNEVPPPEPFPLEVLPAGLREFVEEAAWALNCPSDFAAVPLLGLAGGAIGNTRRLAITRTHTQSACLFAVVVGSPGSGKSPALQVVAEPFEAQEKGYRLDWQRQMDEWRQAADEQTPKPRPRRLLLDDVTTERMVGLLEDNPRGLCMVRDELSALVTGMDQYKGGKGYDRQIFLKLWSGAAVRVDRKNHADGAAIVVPHPFVAIVGGIQPTVVERMRGESRGGRPPDDGFLDRFLFSYPSEPPARQEAWREVSQAACATWGRVACYLLDLKPTLGDDGQARPFLHSLSGSGRSEWESFTRHHAAEINDAQFAGFLRGPWAKLSAYCVRLSLIIHHLRAATGASVTDQVDGDSVARAATLVAYFKAHVRRLYCAMELDPVVAEAELVLRWIRREGVASFKVWEVHKDLKSQTRFQRIEDMEYALTRLCRHNYVRRMCAQPRAGVGRKPSVTYEVNPLCGAG